MVAFGALIKTARKAKGITLAGLGDMVDSHQGYLSGIERGSVRPPLPRLVKKLAMALGMDYHALLAAAIVEKLPEDLDRSALLKILSEG